MDELGKEEWIVYVESRDEAKKIFFFLNEFYSPTNRIDLQEGYFCSFHKRSQYFFVEDIPPHWKSYYSYDEFLNKFSPINEIWNWCKKNEKARQWYKESLSEKEQNILEILDEEEN